MIFAIAIGFTLAIGAIVYSLIPGKERSCEAARARRGHELQVQRRFAQAPTPSRKSSVKSNAASSRRRLQEAGMYTVSPAQMGVRMVACGGLGVIDGGSHLRFADGDPSTSHRYIVVHRFAGGSRPAPTLPFSKLGRRGKIKKRKADDPKSVTRLLGYARIDRTGGARDLMPPSAMRSRRCRGPAR